jgi:hypothetical protein
MHRAERVRQILATRSLTLYSVSQQSAQIFGRSSRFYVPHNLYYDVAVPSFIPTIHQLLALSRITNYRLFDWLAALGCDLEQIPRLRLLIRRQRTTLLDSSVYDTFTWVPWFAGTTTGASVPPIAPLRQFLSTASPKRATELLALNKRKFLYGKVGEADLYALPFLAPGSVVRVDPARTERALLSPGTNPESPFFFVEYAAGFTCSRLAVLGKDRILLRSPQGRCAERELHLGRDARILGTIDAEIRPIVDTCGARQIPGPIGPRRPQFHRSSNSQTTLRELLRTRRIRVGFSFREASIASQLIAETLSDASYFTAPSTLSDYETLSEPPRRIQKVITLCALYGIEFREFLRISGLPLDQEGRHPLPDELVPRTVPSGNHVLRNTSDEGSDHGPSGLLDRLVQQWEEIPLFLRHSLAELAGLKKFSLSDVFWVGGETMPIHPLLINATFVAVNRRVKKPVSSVTEAFCAQPIYLILKRNGSYVCGHCTLEETNLIVHTYPGNPFGAQRFRNELDAEVVGRVTAVLRRLL